MQKFILFDYNLLLDDDGEEFLDSVIVKLVNSSTCEDQLDQEFNELQRSSNFQTMIVRILNIINDETIQFNSVILVAPTIKFFTQILEEEFSKRELQMPFVFQNTLDISKLFKKIQGKSLSSLTLMTEYYKQYQLWSNLSKMRLIILKLNSKDTAKRGKIQQKLDIFEQRQEQAKELQMVLREDRVYKDIQNSNIVPRREDRGQLLQWEIQGYSYYQNSITQKGYFPCLGHLPSTNCNNQSNNGTIFQQGLQQKIMRREGRQVLSSSIENSGYLVRNSIRIRGLPFEITERELVDIFLAYRPIVWSAKMGRRAGAKTGQAVLLLQTEEAAERALQMNGFKIYGRYLQVMLISMRSYSLFS